MKSGGPPEQRASRRAQTGSDEDFLSALFRATHRQFPGGLDPALAELLLCQQLAGQRASYRAACPRGRFDIVEVDGEPVGRIITDAAHGVLRLVDIALLPEWRDRGIGTHLLRALQAEAREAGVPLRLSVLRSNAGARRLYARRGFVVESVDDVAVAMRWQP